MKEVSIFEILFFSLYMNNILGNTYNFTDILFIIAIVFTVGTIISLFVISRQVVKSKWIDSYAIGVLFALIIISLLAIVGVWGTYTLYA